MTPDAGIEQLRAMKRSALHDGGPEHIAARRKRGIKTARERVIELLDPGTFVEFDMFIAHASGDMGRSVITGQGKIAGRDIYVSSQDCAVPGDLSPEILAQKIMKVLDLAIKNGVPIIEFIDSGGARTQEQAITLGSYAEVLFRNVMASGVVPQISALMGPCSSDMAFSPALADFTIMVKGTSRVYLSDPEVVKSVIGEEATDQELGGAMMHDTKSGLAHLAADDEAGCLQMIRRLLSFLPQNNLEEAPRVDRADPSDRSREELESIVPLDPSEPYDMRDVVIGVMDGRDFFEIMPHWAQNLIVGFAHLGGRSVGVVANQPSHLSGMLDIDASTKGARFVRFCDAFNIPLVTFEDIPGFVPGTVQERGGIVRHAAKLLYAFCEATVPKLTVITRKAYGEAYDVMCSRHVRADFIVAWPSATIAAMRPDRAVGREHLETFASPYVAARRGHIDDIIEPRETRPRLIAALEACASKREGRPPKKHGNIPL